MNLTTRILSISCLLLLSFRSLSQNIPSVANWYLRGKAMTMVAFEDDWFSSMSLGTEYRFSKRFSLVLDAVHYSRKFEEEVHNNPDDYDDYDEFALRDQRNYIAFEFKYHYFRVKENNTSLYVNLYSKFGEHKIRKEAEYPIQKDQRFFLNGNFADAGLSLGININITENFGLDVNLGICERFEKQSYWKSDKDLNLSYFPQHYSQKLLPNIRVNFYWTFNSLFTYYTSVRE